MSFSLLAAFAILAANGQLMPSPHGQASGYPYHMPPPVSSYYAPPLQGQPLYHPPPQQPGFWGAWHQPFHQPLPQYPPPPQYAPPPQARMVTKAELTFLFGMMDTDKDGKVSLDELQHFRLETAKSHVRKMFRLPTDVDTNKDGKLSFEEMKDEHTRLGLSLQRLDPEGIKREFAKEESKFRQADINKDGKLEGDELLVYYHADLDHEISLLDAKHWMQEMDQNKDGKITPPEFTMFNANFAHVDHDQNGEIDVEELHHWATGLQDFISTMLRVIRVADKDHDNMLTLQELINARNAMYKTGSQVYFNEWADIHNEL